MMIKSIRLRYPMNNEAEIKVKGCIMIFCRTQYWKLVEERSSKIDKHLITKKLSKD